MLGDYLREVFELNGEARNFRLFGPDETASNRLMSAAARERSSGVYSAMSSTPNDAAYEIRRGRPPAMGSSTSRNCVGMSAYRARHTWSLPTTKVR